ncbi:YcjF family protein [Hoeflea sp.]|uniref:YcjF family protein n=1 Tax=Hoeflea sp. TaxID=1940281 RepID=UPI003B020364
MTKNHRKPAAFDVADGDDDSLPLDFAEAGADTLPVEALTPPVAEPRRRGISFGRLALGAFGLLFSLAFAVWLDGLIASFFARSIWLGWLATALTVVAVGSLVGLAVREIRSLMRLDAVHAIREMAEEARLEKLPKKAKAVQARLMRIFADRPETARARRQLRELDGEVIDGPHLMELMETQLLGPVDQEARRLILNASKRVSVVTALSPRALIDIGYVLFEAMRLIRALATLYGGRPGTLGAIRLARDVVSHLAVTGSLALGDGVIQQLMGQGLASKLSARLGEGVVNGLMTARIGIAAMDLCRPLAFHSLKRPGIGEFVGDLTRQAAGGRQDEKKEKSRT